MDVNGVAVVVATAKPLEFHKESVVIATRSHFMDRKRDSVVVLFALYRSAVLHVLLEAPGVGYTFLERHFGVAPDDGGARAYIDDGGDGDWRKPAFYDMMDVGSGGLAAEFGVEGVGEDIADRVSVADGDIVAGERLGIVLVAVGLPDDGVVGIAGIGEEVDATVGAGDGGVGGIEVGECWGRRRIDHGDDGSGGVAIVGMRCRDAVVARMGEGVAERVAGREGVDDLVGGEVFHGPLRRDRRTQRETAGSGDADVVVALDGEFGLYGYGEGFAGEGAAVEEFAAVVDGESVGAGM